MMLKRRSPTTQTAPRTEKLPAGEYPVKIWGANPSPKATPYNPQCFLLGEVLEGRHKGKFIAQCFKSEFGHHAVNLLNGYDLDGRRVTNDLLGALNELKGKYAFAIVNEQGYVSAFDPADPEED